MNQTSDLQKSILDLLQRHQSLVLATADQDGIPNCSHAPYLLSNGNFYVLVSGLAKHTANLLQSRRCHVQVLADEQETVNPFARKRLSYLCKVEVVSPQSKEAADLLVLMRQRFGPTIDMLASLSDFQLLRLVPESGSVVLGFGQAHPAPLPSQLS
jgi:putative heme iron utilization protein